MPSRRRTPLAELLKIADPQAGMMTGVCGACAKPERREITLQGVLVTWHTCGYNNRNDRLQQCRFFEVARSARP